MKLKHLFLLVLIVPFLQACDNTDDVAGIFTGKTWKMTGIYYKKHVENLYDFWNGNEAARAASVEKLNKSGNFIINFDGLEADGVISGSYSGRATSSNFSGGWRADGESNAFTSSNLSGSDSDVLGQAFLNGIRAAYKYDGDYNNLRLHYKLGQEELFILFHVSN